MFMRVDKLQAELPAPKRKDPNAAAALQELLGGKYGEMSTLGNYMFQSFNFRSKSKLRPFYSLVAAITAEELGHVELVSNGVSMLANGPDNDGDETDGGDITAAPFSDMKDMRLAAAFLSNGGGATPVNSNGAPWNNDFITTTATWVTDLLHNFTPGMRRAPPQAAGLRDPHRSPRAGRCAATCWCAARCTPMPTRWP
jgi:Mn-containing catalase